MQQLLLLLFAGWSFLPMRLGTAASAAATAVDSNRLERAAVPRRVRSGNPRRRLSPPAAPASGNRRPGLSTAEDQNYFHVEMRIVDRVSAYMDTAVDAVRFVSNYRYAGGFRYGLTAPDRDQFLVLVNGLSVPNMYVGMEDGLAIGLFQDGIGKRAYAIYREPGNAGYRAFIPDAITGGVVAAAAANAAANAAVDVDRDEDRDEKEDPDRVLSLRYLKACVDPMNGTQVDCILKEGQHYIRDPPTPQPPPPSGQGQPRPQILVPCDDEASQKNCSSETDRSRQEACEGEKKYCARYTIEHVPENAPPTTDQQQQQQQTVLGYIPATKMCIDPLGRVTESTGAAVVGYVPGSVDLASSVRVQLQIDEPSTSGGSGGGSGVVVETMTYPPTTIATSNSSTVAPSFHWSSSYSSFHVLGNCTYGDGTTLVQRAAAAANTTTTNVDYAYCRRGGDKDGGGGGGGGSKDRAKTTGDGPCPRRMFAGGYQSNNFDPRYRPWYTDSKHLQHFTWTDPYPFHFDMGLGITASHPLYNEEVVVVLNDNAKDGDNKTATTTTTKTRKVFAGVIAVDYKFDDIRTFLVTNYGHNDTDTFVAIYEEKEPNYVIALSTGTPGEQMILIDESNDEEKGEAEEQGKDDTDTSGSKCKDNKFTSCPITSGTSGGIPYMPQRIPMGKIASPNVHDTILRHAYQANKDAGYPDKIVTVPGSDEIGTSNIFLTHSVLYEQPMTNLRWRVVVAVYTGMSGDDSITIGDPLFGALIAVGVVGFIICLAFATVFYRKRKHRAIIFADWRFTCYFIIACSLLNCSTLALLGPNTNPLCMLRMWSFHGLLVVVLSPLFVKIWRLKQLLGTQQRFQRRQITNTQAALRMLPMISIQMAILLIISLVDPPKQTDVTKIGSGVVSNFVVCSHKTQALLITEAIYEGGLVVIGCILAFQTRDQKHSESKALIFAMYNIALAGVIFFILLYVQDLTPSASYLLQGIGVWWGTVFSSVAFVIPHIIQVRRDSKSSKFGHICVSGLNLDHMAPEQLGSNSSPGNDNNTPVPSPISEERC